jgi:Protein kinase domain
MKPGGQVMADIAPRNWTTASSLSPTRVQPRRFFCDCPKGQEFGNVLWFHSRQITRPKLYVCSGYNSPIAWPSPLARNSAHTKSKPCLALAAWAEVYPARDTRLERSVAIKILPAQFSTDPVRKQRFEREAKTISSLNHPRICVLHDIGSRDGIDYLVMESVEGETLAKRLEKGTLSLKLPFCSLRGLQILLRRSRNRWVTFEGIGNDI